MGQQKVRTYDPDRVIVTVNGQRIEGLASGDSIKATRDAEYFTKQTGVQGAVSRSRKHSIGGQITLTLQQTAPENKIFSDRLKLDLLTGGALSVIQIQDTGGESLAFSEDAWIMQDPEQVYGEESGNREWVFDCAHLRLEHGQNF